jgi:hypothetical protein
MYVCVWVCVCVFVCVCVCVCVCVRACMRATSHSMPYFICSPHSLTHSPRCGVSITATIATAGPATITVFGGVGGAALSRINVTVTVDGSAGSVSQLAAPCAAMGQQVCDSMHFVTVEGMVPGTGLTITWMPVAESGKPPQQQQRQQERPLLPQPPTPHLLVPHPPVLRPSTTHPLTSRSALSSTSDPINYTKLPDTMCDSSHGAVDIDPSSGAGVPPGNFSAVACMALCSSDAQCSCVQHERTTGRCFRRARCLPSKCAASGSTLQTDVYVCVCMNLQSSTLVLPEERETEIETDSIQR